MGKKSRPCKDWRVKTNTGNHYKIKADYIKYEHQEDGDVIFFMSHNDTQENYDGSHEFVVAFVKAQDVEIIGADAYLTRELIPMEYTRPLKSS